MWALLVCVLAAGLIYTFYKVKQRRIVSLIVTAGVVIGMCLAVAVQLGVFNFDNTPTDHHLHIDRIDDVDQILNSASDLGLIPTADCCTAWTFSGPLTDDLLANIKHFHKICASVHVYCGTSQCVQAVSELNNPSITSEFLVISDLVKDAPLQEWFARHPLYKVYGWLNFEDHLQRAVQLGILWKYGGIYIDPRIRITGNNNRIPEISTSCHNGWTSSSTCSGFDAMCFPKHHELIAKLSEEFTNEYKTGVVGQLPHTKFIFDFVSIFEKTLSQCIACPDSVTLDCVKRDQNKKSLKKHFGILSYYLRAVKMGSANLGDEIQAISGLQYLPFVDKLLERDKMNTLEEKNEPVTAFLNAWYGYPYADWPPPSNVRPFVVSIHAHIGTLKLWRKKSSVNFFKQHEPIGCRDTSTMDFMEELGVSAYFSGCMTLMIKNPNVTERSNKIIITDVKTEYKSLLPKVIKQNATHLHHAHGVKENNTDTLKQFTEAYRLLQKYENAKLVITQRIHSALPSVGMGIPVIFIQSGSLPGDMGAEAKRTSGLTDMFHTVDLYKMSTEEAAEWLINFDYDNPPPNPNPGMMMRMRTTFWNVMRENQDVRDAAYKFGMIPLQPPPVLASERERHEKLTFHLVFTESTFKWYHWRTVESIFHHHPFAKVTIHSNTLQQSEFHVLVEGGYSIKVEGYSLADLLKNTPAEGLSWKLSSDSNLLRLLVLYKWGGIYLDNDMIVVNPLDKLPENLLTWEDNNNRLISGSFMALGKGNDFLRDCLAAIEGKKDQSSTLLTSVWEQRKRKGEVVAMNSDLFYMFTEKQMVSECFSKSASFDEKMEFLKEKAYAVRLKLDVADKNEVKLSKGTICKYALNSFCVLCNNIY